MAHGKTSTALVHPDPIHAYQYRVLVRFWAVRSRAVPGGFDLEFPGGLKERVEVLDRQVPTRMAIRYFGSEAEFELTRREDGGCLFQVTSRCDDPAA